LATGRLPLRTVAARLSVTARTAVGTTAAGTTFCAASTGSTSTGSTAIRPTTVRPTTVRAGRTVVAGRTLAAWGPLSLFAACFVRFAAALSAASFEFLRSRRNGGQLHASAGGVDLFDPSGQHVADGELLMQIPHETPGEFADVD
jgi:hypothetical protein